MDLFFILLVLLVTTRSFGEVAVRLGQPALVGELVAGIALGTIIANYSELAPYLSGIEQNPVFTSLTDLGMFFIMLYAGVELQPSKLIEYSKGAIAVAISGMVIPMAMGIGLAWVFLPQSDAFLAQSIFLGTALAITAVPATIRVLMDLGKLESPSGQIIVSAAVFDDVLSLVLLTWLTAMIGANADIALSSVSGVEFGTIMLKVVAFFVITIVIGIFVFPFGGKFMRTIQQKEFEFTALLVGALAFSVLAEMLELHFIIGAFIAGLFFDRKTIDESAYNAVLNKTSAMTYGFLAPIFFASIGLHLDISALFNVPIFVLCLVLVAFAGKFFGAGLAAYWIGLSKREAAAVGAGMSARGAVELVIADIALKAGLFDNLVVTTPVVENIFSAVVIMAVVTTVVTPVLLKLIYTNTKKAS